MVSPNVMVWFLLLLLVKKSYQKPGCGATNRDWNFGNHWLQRTGKLYLPEDMSYVTPAVLSEP